MRGGRLHPHCERKHIAEQSSGVSTCSQRRVAGLVKYLYLTVASRGESLRTIILGSFQPNPRNGCVQMKFRPTQNGYQLSEVVSALQKEIRRGKEREAMF